MLVHAPIPMVVPIGKRPTFEEASGQASSPVSPIGRRPHAPILLPRPKRRMRKGEGSWAIENPEKKMRIFGDEEDEDEEGSASKEFGDEEEDEDEEGSATKEEFEDEDEEEEFEDEDEEDEDEEGSFGRDEEQRMKLRMRIKLFERSLKRMKDNYIIRQGMMKKTRKEEWLKEELQVQRWEDEEQERLKYEVEHLRDKLELVRDRLRVFEAYQEWRVRLSETV